jgi:nucleotide-binding universal stress UspA family protein
MESLDRILVAVDPDGLAANAVVAGFLLAERLPARVDFLHVVERERSRWRVLTPEQERRLDEGALGTARRRVKANLVHPLFRADIPVVLLDEHLRILRGHAAETILSEARRLGVDMIVLGPHERRGVFDQGGTARAVVAGAEVPVWTQVEESAPIERILVPVDFSEPSRTAVEHALLLARALGASLTLLHCYVSPPFPRAQPSETSGSAAHVIDQERRAAQEALQGLLDTHAGGPVALSSQLVEDDPLEGVRTAAEDHDLVVLGTHGRTGLARFLLGSTAYGVLRRTRKPVVLVPSPHRVGLLEEPVSARVAGRLDEIARLLEEQDANPFRIQAYRTAAGTLRTLDRPVCELIDDGGSDALRELPGIGQSLAQTIERLVRTDSVGLLDRLRGGNGSVLDTVPGIGRTLAERIRERLGIEDLIELEAAAQDGRLATVPGMGGRRIEAVHQALASRVRPQPPGARPVERDDESEPPTVAELLDVDTEYRRRARERTLPRTAPRRFNPTHAAWLPILHTERGDRHYTALFSNTARAHELGTTHDWVVIYRDDHEGSGRWTVITSRFGRLRGQRIVRGREEECEEHYVAQRSAVTCR